MDTPCTQAERDAIVAAAIERQRYIAWLADVLDRTSARYPYAAALAQREAAKAIRQLAGIER